MVSKDECEFAESSEFEKTLGFIDAELKTFFASNKVLGKTVTKFVLKSFMGQKDIVEIYPDCFYEDYHDDVTDKKLMEIGSKYDVWLHFTSSIYPK